MSFKNNSCPRCKSALTDIQVAQLKQREMRGGRMGAVSGVVLGLIGAGLGLYFGVLA